MKRNTFIQLLKWAPALGAFALIVGCSRSSDTAYTTPETSKNAMAADQQSMSNTLSATSNTNAPDRVYSSASSDTTTANAKDADNTGRNERDRSGGTLTPGDQGKSQADRDITQNVRKAIMGNDQLSSMAKNIKIITIDGKVTLRGPVKTADEQSTIASLAQNAAGVSAVDNQLEVKANNQ